MLDDAVSNIAQDSHPAAERLLIQALEAASSLDDRYSRVPRGSRRVIPTSSSRR
jgi:hypothetical protein